MSQREAAQDPAGSPAGGIGASLRRAWIAYQRRLDDELAAAGFSDRSLPDGRVLRLCARSEGVTTSQIGRELAMTRQGAGKIVAALRERGYVTLDPSSGDGREKAVVLTPLALDYLAAQRRAARRIELDLRDRLGPEVLANLAELFQSLGGEEEQPTMRDYLRRSLRR